MGLGRRKTEHQTEMWVATPQLPVSPGHVFYEKLNQLLAEAGFDTWIENLCQPYYAETGRPGIAPGVYFRMLLVGYFEGIGSQRGIAWRCSDSLSLRQFLGLALTEDAPDHSSLTVIRNRLPLEVHTAVFAWVLSVAHEKKLLNGKTVAVDSTTLEANAAMKSIVRRDTEENWQEAVRPQAVTIRDIHACCRGKMVKIEVGLYVASGIRYAYARSTAIAGGPRAPPHSMRIGIGAERRVPSCVFWLDWMCLSVPAPAGFAGIFPAPSATMQMTGQKSVLSRPAVS